MTITTKSPFLREQRNFPTELQPLSIEVNKAYVDTANAVNNRTIGQYAVSPTVTGNVWYTAGPTTKQQTVRQVYIFTSTAAINHGITNITPDEFIGCYGSYTDGTLSYGLIFGTSVAIAGVIQFYLSTSQIIFVSGAGAPSLTSGKIVLEWLV